MRITEIIVEGLFGIFDHTISLNTEERVTIIHGPNGFGKTILLQMLNGLFNNKFTEFRSIPFRKFEVRFEEGSAIWVDELSKSNTLQQDLRDSLEPDDRATREHARLPKTPIIINFLGNNGQTDSFPLEPINADEIPLPMIEEVTGLERIRAEQWLSSHGEILSLDEVIDRFGHLLPLKFEERDWWVRVKESTKIHLIGIERLFNISGRRATRGRFIHSRSPGGAMGANCRRISQ